MILAFVHRTGTEPYPDLCVIASKPDAFSVPVCVDSLPRTNCAICRLSNYESVLVEDAPEGGIIIRGVTPHKIELTPTQTDTPGRKVNRVRVIKRAENDYEVHYMQDKDVEAQRWTEWNPAREQR